MSVRSLTLTVALLALPIGIVGCSGGDDDDGTDPDTTDTDTDTDTATDTDTDTDTETGIYVEPNALEITNLQWSANPSIGTVITVSWDQGIAGDVQVEFEVDEGVWQAIPPKVGEVGPNEQLLLGIPFGYDANWHILDGDGNWLIDGPTIEVADPPNGLPVATNPVSDPDNWLADGNYLLGSTSERARGWSGGDYWMWVVDRAGRPVWAQLTPGQHWTLYATIANTGDYILYDEQTYWSFNPPDEGRSSKIHAIYLDRPIETYDAEGLHHAFIQMPDGSLVWGSKSWRPNTESLLQWAPGDKEPTELWNCRDSWPGVSNCESNSMWYDEYRDTFLYSFYTTGRGNLTSALVELDRSTGNTLWWAGIIDDGMEFDPPESRFSWQHGVNYTEEGTLLLSTESAPFVPNPTIYAREYEVDIENNVLRQVWSYDTTFHADTNGDVKRLSNDHILHAVGSSGQVIEYDASGNVVWRLDFGDNRLVGRVEYFEDLYDLVSPENK